MNQGNLIRNGTLFEERYYVCDLVGAGGMAEVYLAHDMQLDRPVALKVLLPKYASNPQFIEGFRREAQAAGRLSNANVVKVYEWGTCDSLCYMVMEYVDGLDLKSTLREFGPMKPSAAATFAVQICSALEEAHGFGIIHCDVKPANIMLLRAGTVKLSDFGIVRARNATLRESQSPIGTLQYMSPEQARGDVLRAPSDIYALGATLYEICTGALPRKSPEPNKPACFDPTPSPLALSAFNPEVDKTFEGIVLTCLQREPDWRFRSAHALKAALTSYLATHPDEGDGPFVRQPARWVLAPLQDVGPEGRFNVNGPVTVGRDSTNDLQIDAIHVSRNHVRLEPTGGLLRVEDLDSSNGTFVNGTPVVGAAYCFPGDVISLGTKVFMRVGRVR